jgi:hypothetical protein
LAKEWEPDGPNEQAAVRSIADAMWRKRRSQEFLMIELVKNSVNPNHGSYSHMLGLMNFAGLVKQVTEVAVVEDLARHTLSDDKIKYLRAKFPHLNFNSTAEWVLAMIEEIKSVLLPKFMTNSPLTFAWQLAHGTGVATVTDDRFIHDLAPEERPDAAIDRVIKRLIQIKVSKQTFGAVKMINHKVAKE